MENTNIVQVDLSQELKQRYIDYAMSVIVKRALPDPRDGLKPVLRRILYSMEEGHNYFNASYRKSARTVGDTMGKYHPHGDSSIYEAMVNAAQPFDMRYPLVDGHGNFGSLDGDGAAAMRYTEARLSKLGQAMLLDIDKNTVDMKDNFDSSLQEPSVLPTLFPNALANGVEGIAVGMATKMAPHNLTEIYNALIYIIDSVKEGIEPEESELLKRIKGPDFPLGGQIVGTQGIYDAFTTGRGKIVMRSKYEIIESKRSIDIIVTDLPYKVNKAWLVDKIAQLSKKSITEIKNVQDESNKEGIRVVIELKKDCNVDLVINRLLKSGCGLQKTYSINNTVIINGVPKVASTVELLEIFFKHSIEVVMKKTEFDYNKAAARYAIVNAILWVLEEKLDEVVSLIRSSKTQEDTINGIKALYSESYQGNEELSDEQARAIAEMRLRHLSEDNVERYTSEANTLAELINSLSTILTDQDTLFDIIKDQYIKMRDEHGDVRRTEIIADSSNIKEEDLVADETLILTYTTEGIIKTVSEAEYEVTNRGTKGTKSGSIKEDEAILYMQTVHSKDYIVFFTSLGKCYALRAFQIQKTSRTSRGKSIYNYLSLQEGEKIVSLVNIAPNSEGAFTLITKLGAGKRLSVNDLPQTSVGARAITFREDDELIAAIFGQEEDNMMVTTRNGMSISFKAVDIRVMGRTASGVKAIDLREGDSVVDATILRPDETVLTVTELGLGKRTDTSEFTIQKRGGSGVKVHKLNEKTGQLVCAMSVKVDDELFVATAYGLIVRTRVEDISTFGRNTSGVKIVRLNDGDSIVSISVVQKEEEVEDDLQQ